MSLQELKQQHHAIRSQKPGAMAPYLQQWWNKAVVMSDIGAWDFLECVVDWYVANNAAAELDLLDKSLKREGIDVEALRSRSSATAQQGTPLAHGPVFLEHILLPLADEDKDGQVGSCLLPLRPPTPMPLAHAECPLSYTSPPLLYPGDHA